MQNHSLLAKSAVATLLRSRLSLVAKLQVVLEHLIYLVHSSLFFKIIDELMSEFMCLQIALLRSIVSLRSLFV